LAAYCWGTRRFAKEGPLSTSAVLTVAYTTAHALAHAFALPLFLVDYLIFFLNLFSIFRLGCPWNSIYGRTLGLARPSLPQPATSGLSAHVYCLFLRDFPANVSSAHHRVLCFFPLPSPPVSSTIRACSRRAAAGGPRKGGGGEGGGDEQPMNGLGWLVSALSAV
jgi:hypothetical protein